MSKIKGLLLSGALIGLGLGTSLFASSTDVIAPDGLNLAVLLLGAVVAVVFYGIRFKHR